MCGGRNNCSMRPGDQTVRHLPIGEPAICTSVVARGCRCRSSPRPRAKIALDRRLSSMCPRITPFHARIPRGTPDARTRVSRGDHLETKLFPSLLSSTAT
jgi:hypothetical protein